MDEESRDSIGSAFHGKIMIISIVILFFACFFIVTFHLYARCFHHRRARVVRHAHRRGHGHGHGHLRRSHINVLDAAFTSQGLDICVLKSIPTFIYASKSHESPPECVVCLSEFEDNEVGRVLPGCKHGFHVECIDMWFQSHSDCPLCRAQVQFQVVKNPIEATENLHERDGSISEPAGPVTVSDCDRSSPLTPMVGGRIKALQLNGLIHNGPMRINESSLNLNYESDIESGSNPPASSVRVLKRLFSI